MDRTIAFYKDDEIFKYIKDTILKLHPVVEDRTDLMFHKRPEMNIEFEFGEWDEKNSYTQIMFLDGNSSYNTSIDEELITMGLLNIGVLCKLFNFLLEDHVHIKGFWVNPSYIDCTFSVDLTHQKGISCSDIGVNLDFRRHPKKEELIEYYSKSLINIYIDKLKDTDYLKGKLDTYCYKVKKEVLSDMTEERVRTFFSMFTLEELKGILMNLDNITFMKVNNLYNNELNNEDEAKRKLLKD